MIGLETMGRGGLLCFGIVLVACAGEEPLLCARAPDAKVVAVPYPPPAALPEVVPEGPEGAVWSDGQWIWRRGYWIWRRGGWIEEQPDLCRVRARTYFYPDGTIGYAEAFWVSHAQVVEPPIVKPAGYPPSRKTTRDVVGP